MSKIFSFIMIVSVLFLSGCGTQSGTSDGGGDGDGGVATLVLASDKTVISSGGADDANLTVQALDSHNAVLDGVEISLSASGGRLSVGSVITDTNGEASFTLDSGVGSVAQVITVTASSGSKAVTKAISVLGTSISLSADKSSVSLNGATKAILTATVTDGSGLPVENMQVTLSTNLGTINDSTAPVVKYSNSNGKVDLEFAGGSEAGTAIITAALTEGGTETSRDSVSILLSDEQFSLSDNLGGTISINGTDTVTLTWVDAAGTPVSGNIVSFEATKGTFDGTGNNFVDIVTNASGQASTVYRPDAVGDDTIIVSYQNALDASLPVTILAGTPNSVALSVNPTVVSRALNGVTPTAVVSATVLDVQNRAVQGAKVAFSLTSGPGGGEGISPATATTNAAGIASATFTSGGLISARDGITVLAKLVDYPGITDSATLTIAAQAATITIGQTNVIQTITVGTAESAYALPLTVLVTDTNGSAIANQNISLSVYPTEFQTGYFVDSEKWVRTVTGSFTNEDLNRNGILDPGEDTVGGIFDNNRLDPGGVVSIPSNVTTDSNGFGGFNLVYAKGYGPWVTVEVTATTNVSGTESKAVLLLPLAVEDGDTPYLNSPFGR